MKDRNEPRRVIDLLLLVIAGAAIALLISLTFLLFRPEKEAARSVIPSIVASLVAVLVVYIFTRWPLRSVARYLTKEELRDLSEMLASELREEMPGKHSTILYNRWYAVPWDSLLADAHTLTFCVSYMDTWVTHASMALRAIFERGGTVRAILPKPGGLAANRVLERFPEYQDRSGLLQEKIAGTSDKFQALLDSSANRSAKLEVFRTELFIMHCLVLIDDKYLVISPFDHFRRGHIEAPAVVVHLNDRNLEFQQWAEKEFAGFVKDAERQVYSVKAVKHRR